MSSEADSSILAPLHLDKLKRACDECWKKCDMKKPTCSQCVDGSRSCSYDRPSQRPGVKKGYMPLLESKVRLLENELKLFNNRIETQDAGFIDHTMVKYFFQYVNRYLGVFHEPSFMATLNAQPISLLYIMYALGLLYYQADTEASFDFTLLDRYCKLSQSDMTLDKKPTMNSCSTLLLITHYAFLRGDQNTFLMSQSLVVRQAYVLRLHRPADEQFSFLQNEIRSRLWWSVYCLDRTYSVYNFDIPSQILPQPYPIQLPCADSKFNAILHRLPIDSDRSVRGHMIVLMGIYGRIANSKNSPNPYDTRIIDAALMDWHHVVKDIIIDIDLDDERLASYDDDYWLKLFTKAMYHGAYILLYKEEFGEFSRAQENSGLSEIQLKIFHSCISSASSIARLSQFMGAKNPKCLNLCPFIDFCWYLAGCIYSILKKSHCHSGFYSEINYEALLYLLKVKSNFSNFATILHDLLINEVS